MKVLVITPIYYIKGRENLFHDSNAVHYLLKYWPENVEIVVVHEYHSSPKQFKRYIHRDERRYYFEDYRFESDGIKVRMVELPILPKQKNLTTIQKKRMVRHIQKNLKELSFEPDVVICHQPAYYSSQYINQLKFKAPVFAVLHYSDVKEYERNPDYLKCLIDNYNKIYCRSNSIKEYFKRQNLHVEDTCVMSGVPTFDNCNLEKHYDTGYIEFLFVGKLIKRKNVDMIIRALGEAKGKREIRLTVIGEGPELNNLKRLCDSLELDKSVQFYGVMSREEVYRFMGKSDVFVMPSTNETLGLVYLESMRQGCIPIGTMGEGIDGIIENGKNGFLVKPNDEKGLVKTFETLLNAETVELERLSTNSFLTGDSFQEEKMSLKYYKLISDAIG